MIDSTGVNEWIEAIAFIVIIIIGVFIIHNLENNKSKKIRMYQKVTIFTTLIDKINSKGSQEDFHKAIAQISMVFYYNRKIIDKLEIYKTSRKSNNEKLINTNLEELVVEIAKDMGYAQKSKEEMDETLVSYFSKAV